MVRLSNQIVGMPYIRTMLFCASLADWALMLQYTKSLEDLRKHAEEDMDVAKRKDGLEWVNVDPAQLKPKLA